MLSRLYSHRHIDANTHLKEISTRTHVYIRREVHPEWAPLGAARMREMIDGEVNLFDG